MRRLSLAFVLVVGVLVGAWVYNSQADTFSEGSLFGLGAEVEAGEDEVDVVVSAVVDDAVDAVELGTPPASEPIERKRSPLPDHSTELQTSEIPDSVALTEGDELAGWTGPWPKYAEAARRRVLARESSLDEKGSALKALQAFYTGDAEDPRTEDILLEAAWILENTSDAGVLDDVLDGIEDIQHNALIDPVIAVLINHASSKVRSGAVSVLKGYDNERAKVALEHAAQYDEDERVREKAAQ